MRPWRVGGLALTLRFPPRRNIVRGAGRGPSFLKEEPSCVRMAQLREAVIVDAIRTPFGKRNGSFKDTHPEVLAAAPLNALRERLGLKGSDVDDVIYGNVTPVGEQGLNIARKAALLAGWGDVVPGVQLNRMCGSGQQAVNFAAQGVMSGVSDRG